MYARRSMYKQNITATTRTSCAGCSCFSHASVMCGLRGAQYHVHVRIYKREMMFAREQYMPLNKSGVMGWTYSSCQVVPLKYHMYE